MELIGKRNDGGGIHMQTPPLKCAGFNVYQIKPPAPDDLDEHPRLLINGEGIHAGALEEIMLPGCWLNVRLEIDESISGPGCWYIASPAGLRDVCPVGLFVRRPL